MRDFVIAVKTLLDKLDRIGEAHEELMDTEVREYMHLTLNAMFVWDLDSSPFPCSFGMFSLEGDREVGSALSEFVGFAKRSQFVAGIDLGQPRLDLLQAESSVSSEGNEYDLYFGHRDAPLAASPLSSTMFEVGDYDDE